MAAPVKRLWYEYPRLYLNTARDVAASAVPTLNEHFDNPVFCGPYEGRRSTNTFRAQWHRFLEALKAGASDPTSHHARLYQILDDLTIKTDLRLTSQGGQEWWLEFAPHPFIVSGWHRYPDIFALAQRRHNLFLNSLDTANTIA